MSVECERAGVGGFGSPMNALSRNAAERNAPRACARLGTRVPLPSGQVRHGVLELCCHPRPLVRLPLRPPPPLLLLLLLPMPQTTGGGVWREPERARAAEPGYARRWPISAPPSGLWAWGGAKALGGGRGWAGPAGNLHTGGTKWYPGPEEPGGSLRRPGGQGRRGQEDWVKWGGGCAGDAAEHPRELRASLCL